MLIRNEVKAGRDDNHSALTDMLVLKENAANDTSPIRATAEEFNTIYEPTPLPPNEQGFKVYRSSERVWAHQLTDDDIARSFPTHEFLSSTGSRVKVRAGQFILAPFPEANIITVVSKEVFDGKFSPSLEATTDSGGIISQADALRQWDSILRSDNKIYSKSTKIHAKVAFQDGVIETIVNNTIERRQTFRKGDYIVYGSRARKYSMHQHAFSSRYNTNASEPAADAKLGKDGFKLFQATGQVNHFTHLYRCSRPCIRFASPPTTGTGVGTQVDPRGYIEAPTRPEVLRELGRNSERGRKRYVYCNAVPFRTRSIQHQSRAV